MKRNTAGQLVSFEARNITTGARVTGDAGNIIPYCQIDAGSLNALNTATITEWAIAKSGIGLYSMQPTQGETNGSDVMYLAISSTPNVRCEPRFVSMVPQGFDIFLNPGGDLSNPVVVTQNNDKTGYSLAVAPPTASAIASAVWAFVIEGSFTAVQYMRLFASALFGKVSGLPTAPKFRDIPDTKIRIDAATDTDGDRTTVTLDGT